MASDCDKEVERIAREGCMMIDDWVFGNTLAEDKYPALKDCLIRVVTDALRIPGDCVRLADGRVVKVLGTLPMTADGCIVGSGGCVFGPSPIEGDGRIITYDWIPPATVSDGDRFTIMAERAYSTRAAAEAARGEGSK